MDHTQKRALTIAVIIAVVFGAYFLRDYFILIVLAAIMAFVYNPSYQWFLRKTKNRTGTSITLTMFFALITIVIPLAVLMALMIDQAVQLVDNVKDASLDSASLKQTITNLLTPINHLVQQIPGQQDNAGISLETMTSWFRDNISTITKTIIGYLGGVVGGFSSLLTKSIIFIFVFMSILKNQKALISIAKKLNPLGEKASDYYLQKIAAMTKAMVRGQFIIAFLQGLADATLLWAVGFDYFFFWLVILTFLSIIPLGGGIIVLPIGVVLLLTGHVWQGLVLILGHIIIVTNIDNVLRPRLVPKSAKLDSALTILSVFAGMAMFGFLGIVIGPVIMIIIVSTIESYLQFVENKKNNKTQDKLFNKS